MSDSDCSSVRFFVNEGMSDGSHCGSQNKLKQLIDEMKVDSKTFEKIESKLFKAEGAQFVELKGFDHAFDQQIGNGDDLLLQ